MTNNIKINLGRINAWGTGFRHNAIIEMELRNAETDRPTLSICGAITNLSNGGWACGGQCLDTIKNAKFQNPTSKKVFDKIYRLWSLYHLNDMHPGTPRQEKAVKEWEALGNKYDYSKVCEYLNTIGLYKDDNNGTLYSYGSGWLYEPIPTEDLEQINALFKIYQ